MNTITVEDIKNMMSTLEKNNESHDRRNAKVLINGKWMSEQEFNQFMGELYGSETS